jgi:hypothetical protein
VLVQITEQGATRRAEDGVLRPACRVDRPAGSGRWWRRGRLGCGEHTSRLVIRLWARVSNGAELPTRPRRGAQKGVQPFGADGAGAVVVRLDKRHAPRALPTRAIVVRRVAGGELP